MNKIFYQVLQSLDMQVGANKGQNMGLNLAWKAQTKDKLGEDEADISAGAVTTKADAQARYINSKNGNSISI